MQKIDYCRIEVSLFSSFKSRNPLKTINLLDWFNLPIHKKNIFALRSLSSAEERKAFKAVMWCITPSGIFSTRKSDGLISHSGLICLDIDGKENLHITDFAHLRNQLGNLKNVLYSSLSASGNGVFCLIPILRTDKHKEHFEALRRDFEKLNIIIDKSCSDVTRLRASTYDEFPIINFDAECYIKLIEKKKTVKNVIADNYLKPLKSKLQLNENFYKVVEEIERNKIDITDNYSTWVEICCAVANELGENGRKYFHLLSSFNKSYHPASADNLYTQCLKNSYHYSMGTFFFHARKYINSEK